VTLLGAMALLASFASAGVAQTNTATPRITSVPATHLQDGQAVVVKVSGFLPNERVRIYECPTAFLPASAACPYQIATLPFLDLDPNGAGSTKVVVRTVASTRLNQPTHVACTSPCQLAAAGVAQDGTSQAAYTPISFSSNGGTLPVTGGPLIQLGLLAVLLLGLGIACSWIVLSADLHAVRPSSPQPGGTARDRGAYGQRSQPR
jgi:hypothetical protein